MPAELATEETVGLSERSRVVLWRYEEARDYPLEPLAARLYAESTEIDAEELRRLKRGGCPPGVAAKILDLTP